jgi:hypothetical protein
MVTNQEIWNSEPIHPACKLWLIRWAEAYRLPTQLTKIILTNQPNKIEYKPNPTAKITLSCSRNIECDIPSR